MYKKNAPPELLSMRIADTASVLTRLPNANTPRRSKDTVLARTLHAAANSGCRYKVNVILRGHAVTVAPSGRIWAQKPADKHFNFFFAETSDCSIFLPDSTSYIIRMQGDMMIKM
jgi:hypothetical protein